MCLRLNSERKRAKEDIVCFKVLKEDYLSKKFVTPFRGFPMEIGKTYTEKESVNYISLKDKKISGGVFHTYANLDIALQTINECGWKKAIVVRCIIPKGSYYYEGKDEDIASKTIVLQQQVEDKLLEKVKFYSLFVDKNYRYHSNLTESQVNELKERLAFCYDVEKIRIVKQDYWI